MTMDNGISIAMASLAVALAAFAAALAVPVMAWAAACALDDLGGNERGWDLSDLTESRPFRALEAVCALGTAACALAVFALCIAALCMEVAG